MACLEVDVGGDGKMLKSVMSAAQKAAPTMAICLATAADGKVIGLFCTLVGLFCALVGLFCALVGLFCALVGLFCA